MKKLTISVFFALLCFNVFAQKITGAINECQVSSIISTLASDEMKGRKLYSPELDKAAEFIAAHFKTAGLQTFKGAPDYRQRFSLITASQKSLKATFGASTIDNANIIVVTAQPQLVVNERSGYAVSKINAGDDLFRNAIALAQNGKNNLVLIDSSFEGRFKRLSFLKRNANKTIGNTIFILGSPDVSAFTIEACHEIIENKLMNVVGLLPGKTKPDEFVIFSAHYDHLGIGKAENGDSIFNGANDDASGTTAVMLLANHFKKLNNNARTLIFVAFTAEESGGFGSDYFSKQLPAEKVIAMFNIEMIGTESKWGKNSAYITGYDKTSMGDILQKNLAKSKFKFYADPYPMEQLFYRSDNATLARLGVPAHTISTSKMDNEPNYHQLSDEVKTLDLKNMTAIINAIAKSAETIVEGKDTPTRVDREGLRR